MAGRKRRFPADYVIPYPVFSSSEEDDDEIANLGEAQEQHDGQQNARGIIAVDEPNHHEAPEDHRADVLQVGVVEVEAQEEVIHDAFVEDLDASDGDADMSEVEGDVFAGDVDDDNRMPQQDHQQHHAIIVQPRQQDPQANNLDGQAGPEEEDLREAHNHHDNLDRPDFVDDANGKHKCKQM